MKFRLFYLSISVFFVASEASAFGLTADQMYRNLLTNENNGILPSYYSSSRRNEDQPRLAFKKAESKPEKIWQEKEGSFLDTKGIDDFSSFQHNDDWNEIVKEVKLGRVTPFCLEAIQRGSDTGNPHAVELLAWMYATGTGLKQDLTKSWTYYLQAAHLGVPSATANARAVYQAMKADERAQLPTF